MSTIEPIKSGLCLRVLEGSHIEKVHPLTRSVISVGRATAETPYSASYITFPEATVSRLHLVLTWEPGVSAYMVHHRSQTNPTLLNGKQVTRSEVLKPGDVMALGRLVLELEKAAGPIPAIKLPRKEETLTLNLRSRGPSEGRSYCIPVEKNRLLLQLNPGRTTAAIAAEETGDLSQVVALPSEFENQLSFEFSGSGEQVRVETQRDEGDGRLRTTRRSVLSFGALELPLRAGNPVEFGKNDVILHQNLQIWLAVGRDSRPPQGTIDGSPQSSPPSSASIPAGGGILTFRNGPWRGATVVTPGKGSQTFLLGPGSSSFGRNFPLKNIPSCRITVQDGVAQIRVSDVRDDQFVDVNGELLFTGESAELYSGSSLLLGDSEFFWEIPQQHQAYSRYCIRATERSHPVTKAEVKIGTAAHCEVKINSQALAPVVGTLKYSPKGFIYHHQNIAMPARVDGNELSSGLKHPVSEGSVLELAPGVEVKLERRKVENC